jgi:Protein of Unknown function (DUF2784)
VLAAIDWLLALTHVLVVLAFVLLWIPRSTARVHGWLVVLTAASWLGLGLWKGLGYCFLTDLEWRVKRARGIVGLPNSFLKYAADFVTGQNLPPRTVDAVAGATFIAGCGIALFRYRQSRQDSAC